MASAKGAVAARKPVGEKIVQPKPAVEVPADREGAARLVRLLGDEQRKLKTIATDAQGRMAKIQEEVTQKAGPHQQRIDSLVDALFLFFDANRAELTENGARKSVDLGTGVIGEHTNPHKVELTDKADAVIGRLKALGLTDFVRKKEEVDRETILQSEENREKAANVKGVKIVQVVEFRVKPAGDEIEEVIADEARLKKRVA